MSSLQPPGWNWDFLSEREAEFCAGIFVELEPNGVLPQLCAAVRAGGMTAANKALLLELRVGHALYTRGVTPSYEIPGEGNSTIDFGFNSTGRDWRLEVMRLEETVAARTATVVEQNSHGVVGATQVLTSAADDPRQSEEGETLKAIQRICQKCEKGGQPYKFPVPGNALHCLIVDTRTFLHGGDVHDWRHIALGHGAVAPVYRRYWRGQPIAGVFDPDNPSRGAANARERVHFIGFVDERDYGPDRLSAATCFVANPAMFASRDAAAAALATLPFQAPTLI